LFLSLAILQGPPSTLLPPNQCYFKGTASSELYSKLFAFVDFGYQGNIFLKAIGTRDEPTVEEIALVLVKDPEAFFQSAGGQKRWDISDITQMLYGSDNFCSQLPCRVAQDCYKLPIIHIHYHRKTQEGTNSHWLSPYQGTEIWRFSGSGEDQNLEHKLLAPNMVAIVDDAIILQYFGDTIFCAPQEDNLEGNCSINVLEFNTNTKQ
jgi:hypothetical protein